ncbi:MAG: DNA repair protein RecN [Mycobacteriaceae bacterium]
MLAEMRIQSLGVIAEANLELHPGLTVLTGETGAGKTMVVTGLHLLSGARADPSRVRTDAPRAVVEGRFTLAGTAGGAAGAIAEAAGAERDDDGSIIAVRTVGADGRSRAHLGGRSVPAGVLSDFTDPLLAVHGQNDQLRLLRTDQQLAALDRSAEARIAPLLQAYRDVREQWQRVSGELSERTSRARELAREADQLRLGLAEIAEVAPVPGEDIEIVRIVRRLGDLDVLRSGATESQAELMGADDDQPAGAVGLIAQARARMSACDDDSLQDQARRLDEVVAILSDVGGELSSYLTALPDDPDALDGLLTRQAQLKQLTRKYAADADGVLQWAEQAKQRLSEVDVSESTLTALAQQREELAKSLASAASKLSSARRKAAGQLAAAVSAELSGLAMGQATLEVNVAPRVASDQDPNSLDIAGTRLHFGASGVDEVELRLAAHPGAPALPVARSASGGELSRVMLALEVVLATADTTATLVFDEVDAGVGGRAAVEVGKRLAKLARTHQVIVVTHLPQVAAFADRHLVVDKLAKGGTVTVSGVRTLDQDQRVAELARMLAGLDDTETGRAHAKELMAAADSARSA